MVGETMKAYPIQTYILSFITVDYRLVEVEDYETISFNKLQKVVEIESVTKVPLECQCRSALSALLKQADKAPKQNHYVKFPFGLMDVNSLRKLLAFYDRWSAQKQVQEEKK